MENNLIIAASFVVYGLAMLLLGVIACRRTRNLSDYIIGGRRLNSFVTALSAEASDIAKEFIILVRSLLHPLPAGICLSAILAAIMSTADSQLLVSSSVLAEDFYKDLFRKDASQRELVRVGRFAVIIIAVFACLLSLDSESMVLDLVAYAWAGFGAAFGPALLMSLFWEKITRNGALAGIITGGLTVIIWKPLQGGIFDLYEIVPGFVLSLLAIIVFSRYPNSFRW